MSPLSHNGQPSDIPRHHRRDVHCRLISLKVSRNLASGAPNQVRRGVVRRARRKAESTGAGVTHGCRVVTDRIEVLQTSLQPQLKKKVQSTVSRWNLRANRDSRRHVKMRLRACFALLAGLLLSGCSVRKFAINKLGDSLANSGTTFASDNDPEFVGQAIPFSLKLIEGLLAQSPKHRGLLFAAASGFTQYSYVYVQQPSEEIESEDVAKSSGLSIRARNLYLRARDYGLRGLETKHHGFALLLQADPKSAVQTMNAGD